MNRPIVCLALLAGTFQAAAAALSPVAGDAAATRRLIQDEIDAAASQSPAGTVELGEGEFELDDQLYVTGGVSVVGCGWEKTTLRQTGTCRVATVKGGARIEGVTVTGGKIPKNWEHGGGLIVDDGTVSWCRIWHNSPATPYLRNIHGGGVNINKGTIDHSIVAFNASGAYTSSGGGIGGYDAAGPVLIDTCLIYGNSVPCPDSSYGGGGVCFLNRQAAVTIRNTTIAGNTADGRGGGIHVSDTIPLTLVNSVVAGNKVGEVDNDLSCALASGSSHNQIGGTGLFVDAANHDYHLAVESPAIRAGTAYEGIGEDLDGESFAVPPSVGCYEYFGEMVVALPTMVPADEVTFSPSLSVSLSTVTGDARIYYTTDGSEPSDASLPYNGPFTISETTTVKARAYCEEMTPSRVAVTTYSLGEPTAPSVDGVTMTPKSKAVEVRGTVSSVGNNLATSCTVSLALGTEEGVLGPSETILSGVDGAFSKVIAGLAPETLYFYELKVTNDGQIPQTTTLSGSFLTTPAEPLRPVPGDPSATRKSIQDEIDVAACMETPGSVVLDEGLFEIDSQLMITGGVTLAGRGWEKTVVRQTLSKGDEEARVMRVKDGSTVKGLTVTGGRLTEGGNYRFGGGILVENGTVSWCCISNNAVKNANAKFGGGICFSKGQGVVDHCVIADNEAAATTGNAVYGGGIGIREPSGPVTVDTCLIYGNRSRNTNQTAGGFGGGLGVDNCSTVVHPVTVRNTTFVGNSAGTETTTAKVAGGAVCYDNTVNSAYGNFKMINCIVADNVTTTTNATVSVLAPGAKVVIDVDYCLFDREVDRLGEHSIVGDPMFRSPERHDFHVRNMSPCIDAGLLDPDWVTEDSLDLDGVARVRGRNIDIGCYESRRAGFAVVFR